jgi:hypothetical protein
MVWSSSMNSFFEIFTFITDESNRIMINNILISLESHDFWVLIWIRKTINCIFQYSHIFGVDKEILSITEWDIKLKILIIAHDCVNIFTLEKSDDKLLEYSGMKLKCYYCVSI